MATGTPFFDKRLRKLSTCAVEKYAIGQQRKIDRPCRMTPRLSGIDESSRFSATRSRQIPSRSSSSPRSSIFSGRILLTKPIIWRPETSNSVRSRWMCRWVRLGPAHTGNSLRIASDGLNELCAKGSNPVIKTLAIRSVFGTG